MVLAKEELGTKRVCPETQKKFYDLNKDPIVSPYTGKEYPRSFFEEIPVVKVRKDVARAKPAEAEAAAEVDDDQEADDDAAPEVVSLEDVEDDDDDDVASPVVDDDDDEDDDIPDIPDLEVEDDDDDAEDDTFLEEEEDDDDLSDVIGGVEGEEEV